MTTTARHRRPSPVGWLAVIGSALLGVALGAGTVTVASPGSPAQQVTTQQPTTSTSPYSTPSQRPAETVRPIDSVAFAPPATDAVGMAVTVLRPEKVKGGVRLTIALNQHQRHSDHRRHRRSGPHDPRFNDATVPMTMIPVRKKLVPGEGYTYQCVFKLPTMDVGHLTFAVGPVSVAGQAAGD